MLSVLLIVALSTPILLRFSNVSSIMLDKDVESISITNKEMSCQVNSAWLPKWIQDYFAWHRTMRATFPGKSLVTDRNAPKFVVLGAINGVHDRLGSLPWAVLVANQTRRLLFLHWDEPAALDEFLLPTHCIDWRLPTSVTNRWNLLLHLNNKKKKQRMMFPEFRNDMFAAQFPPNNEKFWNETLDRALVRAKEGAWKNTKVLVNDKGLTLGVPQWRARLQALGETDYIYNTSSFGRLWHAFFQPSPGLQSYIDHVQSHLGLTPGKYTAVHVRARYPSYFKKENDNHNHVQGNQQHEPDKSGLLFEGRDKELAVQIATRAVKCARTLSISTPSEPIYFFSDSSDLVDFMTHIHNKSRMNENETEKRARLAVSNITLVGRSDASERTSLHLGLQTGHVPSEYFPTFLDLYLAIGARCVSFGQGGFGAFGLQISNQKCGLNYENRKSPRFDPNNTCTNDETTLPRLP